MIFTRYLIVNGNNRVRSGQQLHGEALVLSFYCTDTFRGGHSSILVVGDHRGLIG